MVRNSSTESVTQEFLYIILFLAKTSVVIGFVGVISGIYLCSVTGESDCFLKTGLLIFGTLQTMIGVIRFLFYSSFSSGFDAIWTPQMQGEIQRDERKRQITGWKRATTGALMIVAGILTLMFYVGLFV